MTAPARYERPEVLAEIPLDGHAVIEASAGTGKTYTLEHLIVEILLSGRAKIGEILVVTFTEKATGELRARVRRLLQKLLDLPPGAGPEVPDARCWIVGERQRELLREALAGFDSATICTIHSFCRGVLTENAFANQRLFDEELVDGREAFGAAFRDALREEFATDGENRELLRLFLAEGGSVGDLEETLWRCHDQKAHIEPAFDHARFARLAADCGLDAGAVAQVHSEMASHNKRLMKKFGPCLEALAEAIERGCSAPDLATRLEAFAELQDVDVEYLVQRLGELPESTRGHALVAPLQRLWDLVPSLEALVAARFFPRVSERVARRKREGGQFDFHDMLGLVRDSLEGPHGPALVELLRERYRFGLIDEFQDTDETQWAVFRRLFFLSEGRCRLYLIGDPKQAIYAFRGADVHTYLAAREEVLGAGGARVVIGHNYRSTPELIAGYNRILDQRAAEPFFTGPIRYDEPVESGAPKLAALGPDGAPLAPIQVLHLGSCKSVAGDKVLPVLGARIAREIRRLTDPENPGLLFDRNDGLGPRPLRRRDVYILARSGRELDLLAEALRAAGVEHAFYKQDGLFQSEQAGHVRDLLEAIAHPDDSSRRLRAWLTPFFGLKLAELAGGAELEDGPLVESLHAWKALADERRYERLFGRILDDSGLVRREILVGAGERALTNYLHLFESLLEELGRARLALPEMIAGLRALIDERRCPRGENGNMQRLESERDAVQLLSMHMSKGLEAPVVFLVGGLSEKGDGKGAVFHDEQGRRVLYLAKPSKALKRQIDREEEGEKERLLYVALTRAKARLYLPMLTAVDDDGEPVPPPRLNGCYRKVNDRLLTLAGEEDEERARLFAFEEMSVEAGAAALPGPADLAALAALEPRPELLEERDPEAEYAQLRAGHAGYFVTSYSRMGHEAGADEEREATAGEAREYVAPGPDELPGGAKTGIYLHDLLAEIPQSSAAAARTPEELVARPEVAVLFERFGARDGIDAKHRPHAELLVHTALTARLPLGERSLDGVCRAARLLREMEFLFPVPESSHPLLSRPAPEQRRSFEVRRGFVKGFVDLLFEHEGRFYFGDWKSDSLPRFTPEALVAQVERSYRLQAKLYTLALVKMLGVRDEAAYEARFGGLLYLFLRGMQPGGEGEGVYFERPSWGQVVGWEQELLRRSDFGFGGAA